MSGDDYRLVKESDGTLTVVMGREKRPPSPEPPSSPCPGQHVITPLGEKEGLQGREGKVTIVRAVHNCSPLNAAVIMNDIETVKRVLSSGLSVEEFNRFDCSGSPPICEAAYHNRFEIMQLLLDNPCVNINTTNHLGLTPLCIAAGNTLDNPKMTEILLQRNADVNVRARDGRSSLHIAAEGGRYRIIRRLLGTNSVQSNILTGVYRDGEIYCPPPVILAAANQHEIVVDQLLKYIPHPDSVLRDTKLLTWARNTIIVAVSGRRTFNDEAAKAALQMNMDSNDGYRLPPMPAYGNITEMSKPEDLEAYLNMPTADGTCCRVFQSLIILERCLGLSNKLVSTCIGTSIHVLKVFGKHEEIVQLLIRVFEGISLMERLILTRGFSMMPSHLHVTLSFFLVVQFWKRIKELTEAKFNINFLPFINGLVCDLDTILSLKEQQTCRRVDHWGEAFQTDFTHLLALIACALLSDGTERKKLDEIGLDVVSRYENYAAESFTSLVHLALRRANGITEILKCSGMGGKNAIKSYSFLIEALLHWGCSSYLNTPYRQYFCIGELPLHMAVRLAEMDPCYLGVVNILLCHGAHYDGVSSSGLVPSMIATRDHLKSCFNVCPLPLACLTAKVILHHNMTYSNVPFLSPVLKRFIGYHDTTTLVTVINQ